MSAIKDAMKTSFARWIGWIIGLNKKYEIYCWVYQTANAADKLAVAALEINSLAPVGLS